MLYYNIRIYRESHIVYWIVMFMAVLFSLPASAVELDRVVISAGDGSSLADVAQPVLILDEEALSKKESCLTFLI